jgi:hypothetical protein
MSNKYPIGGYAPGEYNPIGCEHKLPNGFTAWQMQSESSGSGPDFDEHVTICVCTLCGDISISGRKRDSKLQHTNRFNENFHVYVPDAIDAIIKQANFFNEEVKWGRLTDKPAGAVWEKGAPTELKQHFARVPSVIEDNVIYDAVIWPTSNPDYWWAIGHGFKFSIHKDKVVEWLDEQATPNNDAIEFAGFAVQKCFFDEEYGLWEAYDEKSDPFRFTSEELYQLYQKSKSK